MRLKLTIVAMMSIIIVNCAGFPKTEVQGRVQLPNFNDMPIGFDASGQPIMEGDAEQTREDQLTQIIQNMSESERDYQAVVNEKLDLEELVRSLRIALDERDQRILDLEHDNEQLLLELEGVNAQIAKIREDFNKLGTPEPEPEQPVDKSSSTP